MKKWTKAEITALGVNGDPNRTVFLPSSPKGSQCCFLAPPGIEVGDTIQVTEEDLWEVIAIGPAGDNRHRSMGWVLCSFKIITEAYNSPYVRPRHRED